MKKDEAARRYRSFWQEEIDSAYQYRALGAQEKDEAVARVYRELGAVERKHVAYWEQQLRALGVEPGERRPSWRARALAWSARKLGARAVLPTVAAHEQAGRNRYAGAPEPGAAALSDDERTHARILAAMLERPGGASGSELSRIEGRHRNVGGNALRAAVLGANDGLCSNLSLVMGVAGAAMNTHTILLGGMAGLLAGACSMALGEWISVTSSRELAEREIRVERAELEAAPEEEREELQLIYEAKGLSAAEARDIAARLSGDPKAALEVLTREELGLDPEELGGSPGVAAATSFLLFSTGAIIPVAPFFVAGGVEAALASVALSGLALFAIGGAITIFTGRSLVRSGLRQLLLGLAAAGITFGLGRALGVALG